MHNERDLCLARTFDDLPRETRRRFSEMLMEAEEDNRTAIAVPGGEAARLGRVKARLHLKRLERLLAVARSHSPALAVAEILDLVSARDKRPR